MQPHTFRSDVPSSPLLLQRPKNHDPARYGEPELKIVDVQRKEMAQEFRGKIIWLEAADFQEHLLPKPPAHLMSKKQVAQLTRELKKMMKTYPKRAKREKRKEEDVLAEEFVRTLRLRKCSMMLTPDHVIGKRHQHVPVERGGGPRSGSRLRWTVFQPASFCPTGYQAASDGCASLSDTDDFILSEGCFYVHHPTRRTCLYGCYSFVRS